MTVMLRVFVGWTCVCGVLAAAGSGRAQEFDGPAPVNTTASLSAGADEDIQVQPRQGDVVRSDAPAGHPLGSYAGVRPGSGSAPPVPAPKADPRPMITWPGFQMRQDGTSRVFIQSTNSLTQVTTTASSKFSVHLPGAKVAGNTNKLPLETRFFNTPVTRVNIEQGRDGVTLVLDLRADVSPIVSSERGPTGYYFLYIDLPKGEYVKMPVAPADAPPAPPSTTERARHLDSATAATAIPGESHASASADASVSGKAKASAGSAEAKGNARAKGTIKLGL